METSVSLFQKRQISPSITTAVPLTECLLCAKHYSSIHAASKINRQRELSSGNTNASDGEPAAPPRACGPKGETGGKPERERAPACQAQSTARVQKSADVVGESSQTPQDGAREPKRLSNEKGAQLWNGTTRFASPGSRALPTTCCGLAGKHPLTASPTGSHLMREKLD